MNGVTMAAAQSDTVKGVITFGFVGLDVFTGVLLNVENGIEKKQTEIKEREEK